MAQICHRLDGIPLAIELAAAKVRALSAEQIAKRLDDRFRLLTGGSRTALERHQTLRAMLDWSYNFLPAPEQTLFRRLSTFVNGCTLEAAEAVCAGEALYGENILELLEQLVNKSLVAADEWRAETRYRMLETMRQYAAEKLIEAGESELLRDRHLDHYLTLAEDAAPHLIKPEQLEWLDHLEEDHDNLRAALEWSLGNQRPEHALRLTAALGTFWDMHSYWMEGARWLERALALPFDDPTLAEKAARARALHGDVLLASALDNLERMRASAQDSFALCQEGTDHLDLAVSQFYLGFAFYRRDKFDDASRLLGQSLAEFRELKEPYWETWCQHLLSLTHISKEEERPSEIFARDLEIARGLGDRQMIGKALLANADYAWLNDQLVEANAYIEEAEQLYQQIGYKFPISDFYGVIAHAYKDYRRARELYSEAIEAWGLLGEKNLKSLAIQFLGILSKDEGNLAEAQIHIEQALATAREIGSIPNIAIRLAWLGRIHYLHGNLEEAKRNFKESLLVGRSSDFKTQKGQSLVLTAHCLVDSAPHLVVQLLSAVNSQEAKKLTFPALDPFYRGDFDDALAGARQALDEFSFHAAWAEGKKLSIDEVLDLALKTLDQV